MQFQMLYQELVNSTEMIRGIIGRDQPGRGAGEAKRRGMVNSGSDLSLIR